ncbi:ABC transporter permease [Lentibacillus sp. JNUCC-1]|uniref:ABC transporter permease n=1 Tax=Lentibacillus sp. JNUCC-1 TaxID=2654513 RepID=UPI0018D253A0|nr:FtsX-like permease family protein [Lentibacillus sp. JNUCC-1]
MKIILKHILKNLYEKKLRTFIILLTVLLSTMVLFIGLSLNDILNNTYATMVKGAYGDANVLVEKATNEENPLYEADAIETGQIHIDERVDMIQAVGRSQQGGDNVKVSLTGLDLQAASEMNMVKVMDEPEDFAFNKNDAVISSRAASNYDLGVGEQITVEINQDTYTYTIGAISEANGLFYSEIDDILLVVPMNQVNDIYGTNNLVNRTLIKVNDEKVDTFTETLAGLNTHFSVEPTRKLDAESRDDEAFKTTMILSIVIIVMISAYVIFSLSKVIVAERMPVAGTFRSVGASKHMINRMLLMEFLFYGIIGAVMGIILAVILLPVAADSFNEYKAFGAKTVVTYDPVYLAIAFIFGAVFPVMAGMLHIYRAGKKPLKEIILNTTHTVKEQSKAGVFIGVVLFAGSLGLHVVNRKDDLLLAVGAILLLFIAIVLLMPVLLSGISRLTQMLLAKVPIGELKLGVKNIAHNKMVSNNASMIIVVFLLLLMIGITSAGIDQYIKNTVEQDFDVLANSTDMDFTKYEDIETIDGVSEAYFQHISAAGYDDGRDTFIVYGVQDIEKFDRFYSGATFLDEAKANLNTLDNGVVIDTYQAKRYGLKTGDTIRLVPLDQDQKPIGEAYGPVELEIAGTMDAASLSTNRNIAILSLAYYQAHFVDAFNQIEIKTDASSQAETVKENIENHYPNSGLTIQTFEDMIGSQKETVDTLIQGVLVIILLGLVIGLLGVSNNLLVSFIERKKEYAVLYSVCMSKGQLVKMLVYEMIMTFVSVVVIGLGQGFL